VTARPHSAALLLVCGASLAGCQAVAAIPVAAWTAIGASAATATAVANFGTTLITDKEKVQDTPPGPALAMPTAP
jgi:hypothetical protein